MILISTFFVFVKKEWNPTSLCVCRRFLPILTFPPLRSVSKNQNWRSRSEVQSPFRTLCNGYRIPKPRGKAPRSWTRGPCCRPHPGKVPEPCSTQRLDFWNPNCSKHPDHTPQQVTEEKVLASYKHNDEEVWGWLHGIWPMKNLMLAWVLAWCWDTEISSCCTVPKVNRYFILTALFLEGHCKLNLLSIIQLTSKTIHTHHLCGQWLDVAGKIA